MRTFIALVVALSGCAAPPQPAPVPQIVERVIIQQAPATPPKIIERVVVKELPAPPPKIVERRVVKEKIVVKRYKSPCLGLSQDACGAKAGCAWTREHLRLGSPVKAYCHT